MDLDKTTTRSLEALINDDLEHADIHSASCSVLEDGRIIVDEIALRLEDGRIVGIDIGSLTPQAPDAKVMILETYVERDPKRPWVREGWRSMTAMDDYREELADALRPPWRPGDDADRPEDRI